MPKPKKDPILIALGDVPEKWNQFLLETYGLPEDPQPRDEVSESALRSRKDGKQLPLETFAAHQIRFGEEPPKGLGKVRAEHSFFEREATAQWNRSQAFLRIIVRIWAAERKLSKRKHAELRAELLKDVDDHRPGAPLPVFPESLGTPEGFLERWKRGEMEVRFKAKNRANQTFEIWQHAIAPDELDGEGRADVTGHWDGLIWHSAEAEGS